MNWHEMMEQQEIICLGVANRAVDKGVQGVLWGRAPLSNGKKAPPLPMKKWEVKFLKSDNPSLHSMRLKLAYILK